MRIERVRVDGGAWDRLARWAAAGLIVLAVAGCGAVFDPGGFRGQLDAATGGTSATDSAMAALNKGEYGRAEQLATTAVRFNPQDPYASYVLAEVYLNTGRPELARKQYESLVSLDAQQTVVQGTGDAAKRVTLASIARARLAQLNPPPPTQMAGANEPPLVAIDDQGAGAEGAIIRRFRTLQRLLDQGLITRDEFDQRRAANLGAILPYLASPPARDLDLPAPAPSEVVDRMKALVAAYQGRSISAAQLQTERGIILDSLLPPATARRADAPPAITGAVQAAEVVGRLTRYREVGIISTDEENKARKKVMDALGAYEAKVAADQKAAAGGKPVGEGVRLGTYGSEERAMQGWAALQKQFPDQLGSLQPVVEQVKLRRGGSVWRLNAGPVADRRAALAICRAINHRRQTCAPTVLK